MEGALNYCGDGWDHYNQDQKWNVIMAHFMSQHTHAHYQRLHLLDLQLGDIEDTLRQEIHCFHCPHPDGVVLKDMEYRPTGWGERHLANWRLSEEEIEAQVWEDEDFVCHKLGELPKEDCEHPYFWASSSHHAFDLRVPSIKCSIPRFNYQANTPPTYHLTNAPCSEHWY